MVPSHSQGSPPQRSLFGGIDGGILRDYCKEIDAQQIVMSWQKIPPPLPFFSIDMRSSRGSARRRRRQCRAAAPTASALGMGGRMP